MCLVPSPRWSQCAHTPWPGWTAAPAEPRTPCRKDPRSLPRREDAGQVRQFRREGGPGKIGRPGAAALPTRSAGNRDLGPLTLEDDVHLNRAWPCPLLASGVGHPLPCGTRAGRDAVGAWDPGSLAGAKVEQNTALSLACSTPALTLPGLGLAADTLRTCSGLSAKCCPLTGWPPVAWVAAGASGALRPQGPHGPDALA